MTVIAADTLRISVERDCVDESCTTWADPLLAQLSDGYDHCSTLVIPESIGQWRDEHRTARKRAARARRFGFEGRPIRDRSLYADDVFAVNTSAAWRQGRPMSAGYLERPTLSPDQFYPCRLHGIHAYGAFFGDHLFAYAWVYRAGQLALVSQILGHAAHLENDVMFELFEAILRGEISTGRGTLVYNRHDSGTDGLRFFKERLGFIGRDVEWVA